MLVAVSAELHFSLVKSMVYVITDLHYHCCRITSMLYIIKHDYLLARAFIPGIQYVILLRSAIFHVSADYLSVQISQLIVGYTQHQCFTLNLYIYYRVMANYLTNRLPRKFTHSRPKASSYKRMPTLIKRSLSNTRADYAVSLHLYSATCLLP